MQWTRKKDIMDTMDWIEWIHELGENGDVWKMERSHEERLGGPLEGRSNVDDELKGKSGARDVGGKDKPVELEQHYRPTPFTYLNQINPSSQTNLRCPDPSQFLLLLLNNSESIEGEY
ncbi:uncharacterized protein IL334_001992 [Kwoniella shivajii]|uniref:Uncharacterized protein n=1 Tax=Kwoniella shivajii TaxID=564305 RepID=A0ABZ1CTG7_9TREE|nr:hypothetical protein IL334_001992 [Kwoniella shivajii]